jgi:hypothetical protein
MRLCVATTMASRFKFSILDQTRVVEHFGTERSESVGNGRDRSGTGYAGIPRNRAYSVTDGNGWDRE